MPSIHIDIHILVYAYTHSCVYNIYIYIYTHEVARTYITFYFSDIIL